MAFTITGTTGCEKRNGQWVAYLPVIMNNEPRFLTLHTLAVPGEGGGCFNLYDAQGQYMAECQFTEEHKYMHVYRELQQTFEKAIREDCAILSRTLQAPMIVTKAGFEAIKYELLSPTMYKLSGMRTSS